MVSAFVENTGIKPVTFRLPVINSGKTFINIDDDLFDNSQKIKYPVKFYHYKIVADENYYLLKLCTDKAILLDIHGTGYVFYDYKKMNKKK